MRLLTCLMLAMTLPIAAEAGEPGVLRVDNAGFEDGLKDWWVTNGPSDGYRVETGGMNGGKALVASASADGASLRGGGADFNLNPETWYTISAWMKSDTGGGALHVINQGWTWSIPALKSDASGTWKLHSVRFKPRPSRSGKYTIVILRPKQGEVWIDNIRIAAGDGDAAQSARPLSIAHAVPPPVVDGAGNDRAWKSVAWQSDFRQLAKPEATASTQTRFKVVHDGVRLYALVEADEPDTGKLVLNSIDKRDEPLWRDDCIELHLDPGGRGLGYYQFVVNWKGTVFDGYGEDDNRGAGTFALREEWDADVKSAGRVEAGKWRVEFSIPFASLGLHADLPNTWGMNVCRSRLAGKPETSTFAPLLAGKGFAQPARYRPVVLDGFEAAPFQWSISHPETKAVSRDDGLVYEVRTTIQNQTGAAVRIRAVASLAGDRVVRDLAFDKHQTRTVSFDMPFKAPGDHLLRLALERADAPAVALSETTTMVSLEYQPVRLTVPEATYRDCIFASQGHKTMRAVIACEGEYTKQKLTLTLSSEGTEPRRWAFDEAGQKRVVEVSLADLPRGLYRFELTVPGLAPLTREIRMLPHVAGEVWFDSDGNPYVDGEPFIPFGWFHEPLSAERTPEMNAGQGYVTLGKKPLDAMQSYGKKLIAYPYPRDTELFNHKSLKGPFTSEHERVMRDVVEPIRHHPALLGYYLVDEPEGAGLSPEWLTSAYELLRKLDPHHPVIMLNYNERGMRTYYEAGDVLMPDCYPVFLVDGTTSRPLYNLTRWTRTARSLRPTWMVPQVFDWAGDKSAKVPGRAPTFDELRNQVWSCFAAGARGIFMYAFLNDGRPYSLDLRMGPPYLAREARALQAAMYGNVLADGVTVEITPPDPQFTVTLLRFDDDLLLIAANNTYEKRSARFTLTTPVADKKLHVVGEKRSVAVADGSFVEDFAPVATRLFTTRAELAGAVDLQEFKEELAAAERARLKPGNLVGLGGLPRHSLEEIAKTRPDGQPHVDFSSEYNPVYHSFKRKWLAYYLLDGLTKDVNHCNWSPANDDKKPWIEIALPKPGPVGRIRLYTPTFGGGKPKLRGGRVLLRLADESVKQVAEFSGNTKHEFEVRFAAETAKAVRLEPTDFTVAWGDVDWGLLTEFEAYEKWTDAAVTVAVAHSAEPGVPPSESEKSSPSDVHTEAAKDETALQAGPQKPEEPEKPEPPVTATLVAALIVGAVVLVLALTMRRGGRRRRRR